ncbi:hypothetical protein ANCDUO_03054 [Ancylostoma duodenale]|uniref:Uncharacterized protein n=1 Tax=Ancylostoma duodenale TaxID=51022 RepID=A0A0C2DA59_9BILA|nr:hypothetical protein ANCDUO_03054 [Ancylostoma duodenale]
MTLQRFVLHEQRKHPSATGDLTHLLTSLLTAFKIKVKKLDVLSNELMINMVRSSYTSCAMVSEENEDVSS